MVVWRRLKRRFQFYKSTSVPFFMAAAREVDGGMEALEAKDEASAHFLLGGSSVAHLKLGLARARRRDEIVTFLPGPCMRTSHCVVERYVLVLPLSPFLLSDFRMVDMHRCELTTIACYIVRVADLLSSK
jgi:hypothetical protein